MGMKSQLAMYSMFAAIAGTGGMKSMDEQIDSYVGSVVKEEERKKRMAAAKIEINKKNGLKEFIYGENSIWAINQKNADKKAKKLSYI